MPVKPNPPKLPKIPSILRFGELFSGPGGIASGAMTAARQLGINLKHTWAIDVDADSCATYALSVLGHKGVELPSTLINKSIADVRLSKLGPIAALAFGFPCNDFSLVGEKRGTNGKFGELYSYGVKTLEVHNPMFFVAENVGGLRSSGGGAALRGIISDLRRAGDGYTVCTHYYKFEDYGIPQTRHRVILVGISRKISENGIEYRIPAPSHCGKHVSVRDALSGIKAGDSRWKNNELTRQSSNVIARLKCIGPGENAWNSTIDDPALRLNVKNVKLSQIYRRLHPDKPAYTITGSGGGGTHVYHWKEPRALTNRERAALQTFPENYEFVGRKESVRKQIGMAVPPKAAHVIFLSVFRTLLGIDYRSVKSNMPEYDL